jgi:hypothetical protein
MNKYNYTIKDNYLLFWSGHFSNWYPASFIIGSMTFNCVEQYMMYMKAKTFNDQETMDKVMATLDAKEQKKLGRGVKNFNPVAWDLVKEEVVYDGCFAKYLQNLDLKEDIIKTNDLMLVEASPYDKIWGIGMSAKDPDVTDESKWKGENLLGKALMKVRNKLKGNA